MMIQYGDKVVSVSELMCDVIDLANLSHEEQYITALSLFCGTTDQLSSDSPLRRLSKFIDSKTLMALAKEIAGNRNKENTP